ncbi:alanyl-tRNA synthetase [Trypanosoma rangeli]|uniref:Alanyl-tRNA synthetase n=1 Tax=Trypanosoma rangeli TaxID=5698 RepID=A0A422NRG2_TRYRA|nr:alanyl-tRNA synthetase [Trypanosoma rangeli]RNF08031.1 alanyl-tRNA synthetase [Trypanosoma rangeli]|eukprot:RNF08031.1 alanyl-tRNA synthetase [Trypanosoma rangeli]
MSAVPAFVRVGELACQKNPFLRELRARIVSCEAVALKKSDGRKGGNHSTEKSPSYNVVLTDSVLFPEGGGQPCDYGTIIRGGAEEVPVRNVQRRGETCVLSTPSPLEVGEEVKVRVDWPRRLDHMQHHTAQHLLSGVMESLPECQLPTVSWSLTHPYCFIVLPTGNRLHPAVVARIEDLCNDAIARAITVRCDVYASKEAYEQVLQQEAESHKTPRKWHKIPDDVTGAVRIITLEDIDCCTCCGTHVDNLGRLHMIKLLHQETKGETLKLYFITGDRLRRHYGEMYFREKELMKQMGGIRPENFLAEAARKGREFVDMEKRLKNLTLDFGRAELQKLIAEAKVSVAQGGDGGGIVTYRRDDVDMDFFNLLRDGIQWACPDCVAVFAWGTPSAASKTAGAKSGQFLIVGPPSRVEALAPDVCTALEGRGGMSKYGYRGKGSLAGWEKLVEQLRSS